MISKFEVQETNTMISEMKLDVRTITMGISLMDCGHPDLKTFNQKVYDKITRLAEHLVKTGEDLERQFPRRLLRAGAERLYQQQPHPHRQHAGSAGRDLTRLLFRQYRLVAQRHQHGRGQKDGRDHPADGRADRRPRFAGLFQAGRILQCGRG
ncbi:hypothetical protein SAEN111111_13120 [Saccharibacillus endophyticus]